MSWYEITLGDAFRVKHGFAFKSQFFSETGTHVVLTPGNFNEEGGFRSRPGKDRFYSADIPEDFVLREGDLIVAMTEQGPGLLGSSALVPEDGKYLHNQRLGLIQNLDNKKLDKNFLYYLFNTRSVRSQISGSATGTKVRHTAPERIYRVKASIPKEVEEQKRIAATLSAYDDLIENNRRRIQLLEQAARLLYKEWFVHLRFPGHEHVKITDGVPEGWKAGTIGDLGEVITGKTPSKKKAENYGNDLPFIKTPDMHGNAIVVHTEESLSEEGAKTQANKTLPSRSILVSCIGTVGAVAFNASPAQTNQQINSIVPASDSVTYWAYFMARDLKPLLEGMGGGATMANVNKSKFSGIKVVIPSKQLLELFSDFAKPAFDQIENLTISNARLAKARDLLLPKLMIGEVAV
jgi:type I restriction enzyme S subunit